MNGFFNVYKEPTMSSSDVVVKLRGILRSQTGVRYKVGHLGTLDPAAEGVLPVAVGSATKLFGYMLDKVKVYRAIFVWGVETDTLDATGTVLSTGRADFDIDAVRIAAQGVVGTYGQVPPQYSAKSVDGVRAYKLARQGIEVTLAPKEVCVYSAEVLSHEVNRTELLISCSAGTYIRSIVRDMAASMGTVGYMQSLLRVQSGTFTVDTAVKLCDIEVDCNAYFLPLARWAEGLTDYTFDETLRKNIENGVPTAAEADVPMYRVVIGREPYAVGHTENGLLKIICRF